MSASSRARVVIVVQSALATLFASTRLLPAAIASAPALMKSAAVSALTPPVGMVLYVLSKVAAVPFERCVIATAPFLVPLIAVLLLLSFVPSLSMWLPVYLYR